MRPELLTALEAISEGVTLLRAGNPNHKPSGPGGGQFTSSKTSTSTQGKPIAGKHSAKRRKRKAKREARAMRRKHKAERKNLLSDQKHEWLRTQRGHKRELASHRKTAHGERSKLLVHQSGERLGYLKSYKNDPAEAKLQGVAGIKKGLADLRGEQKTARNELVASHSKRLEGLKADHAKELAELKGEHQEYRKDVRTDQKSEKRLFIKELKQEKQGRSYGQDSGGRGVSGACDTVLRRRDTIGKGSRESRNEQARRQMGKGRIHKASSAEAILRHVLRQRGWTKIYGDGGLTGKQHINLLDDVRQYGRQWMRHEAESFFDRYGVEVDETSRGIAQRAAEPFKRFFSNVRGFLQNLVVAGAMALKGDEPLTNAEIYAVDRLTRKQFSYLDKFEQEVQQNPPKEIADLSSVIIVAGPPPMTPGQFIARAELYGNSVWEVQNIGREAVRHQEVFSAERRVHAKPPGHHECRTCIEQSARGWQPVGTLLEIGDSECMGNCDCYFIWQAPGGKVHVSPWGRHNPKGYEQPAIPALPSGPGPAEKKKIKLKPVPKVGEPYPKGGTYPPARPEPTIQEILDKAGSPHPVDYYEEL